MNNREETSKRQWEPKTTTGDEQSEFQLKKEQMSEEIEKKNATPTKVSFKILDFLIFFYVKFVCKFSMKMMSSFTCGFYIWKDEKN